VKLSFSNSNHYHPKIFSINFGQRLLLAIKTMVLAIITLLLLPLPPPKGAFLKGAEAMVEGVVRLGIDKGKKLFF
jgi:hypothetical protein